MSTYYNSNFKNNRCWSCEFYCSHREYVEGGAFRSERVETDRRGTCTNKRSLNNGKAVNESSQCSKYQKWGVLQSSIFRKQLDKEKNDQQRKEEDQKCEREREREKIERERDDPLQKVREAIDHDRWYSSLSPEERQRYDDEKERLETENLVRMIEKKKRIEEEERERTRKNAILKIIILSVALTYTIPGAVFLLPAILLFFISPFDAMKNIAFWLGLLLGGIGIFLTIIIIKSIKKSSLVLKESKNKIE